MLSDAEIAALGDDDKAQLLHSLLKHYTAPTEGLMASLTTRIEELRNVMPEPDMHARREELIRFTRTQDEQAYNYTLHALTTLGFDLTLMAQHANQAVSYAMEVIAELASKKMGIKLDVPHAPRGVTVPAPAPCPTTGPVGPPQCPPSPEAVHDDGQGDDPAA
jgi:hypothetical protein